MAGSEAVLEEGLALGPVGSASGPAESVSALAVLAMAPEASEPEASEPGASEPGQECLGNRRFGCKTLCNQCCTNLLLLPTDIHRKCWRHRTHSSNIGHQLMLV